MTLKKHIKAGGDAGFNSTELQLNPFVQKLPDDKQQTLYKELKSHGEIDNPVKYTETHLEGGIEDELE